jgi:hypothetical protein
MDLSDTISKDTQTKKLREKRLIGGMLCVLIGTGVTGFQWYLTLHHSRFFIDGETVPSPLFVILGLGLILFPSSKEERITRGQDVSGMSGTQLITPRWWAIYVLAIGVEVLNYWLLLGVAPK